MVEVFAYKMDIHVVTRKWRDGKGGGGGGGAEGFSSNLVLLCRYGPCEVNLCIED